MLQRAVAIRKRAHLLLAVPLGLGLAACFLVAVDRLRAPAPIVVVRVPTPPPAAPPVVTVPVTIDVPPPATPPAPSITLAAPVVGTSCPPDVSTIGIPDEESLFESNIAGGSVDGCVLAVWDGEAVRASRDGGLTWTRVLDGPGNVVAARVVGDRVFALRGRLLGVARPGSEIWREVPEAAGEKPSLVAAGVVFSSDRKLLFATSDDGASWRTYTLPEGKEELDAVTFDGGALHVTAEHLGDDYDGGPIADANIGTYAWTDAGWISWRPAGWTYAWKWDRFWGCGGTHKVVAVDPSGVTRDVVNDVHSLLAGGSGSVSSFVLGEQRLYQLRDGALIDTQDLDAQALVGVDGAGDPLVLTLHHGLARWSSTGGLRILVR